MLRHGPKVHEYFHVEWKASDFPDKLEVIIGDPSCQAFFELLAILLGLLQWGALFLREPCLVATDSLGALQNALDQKGSRHQLFILKEIAWRKAKHGWQYDVGHLASEHNVVPDLLSRLAAPGKHPSVWKALEGAQKVNCAEVADIWKCL